MKHFNNLVRSLTPLLLFLLTASPVFAINFSGTYTIPSATFPTLNVACAQLTLGTVTGPTVFNVTAGTYTGTDAQGIIGSANGIAGVSVTNTVTFQAASGPGTVTFNPSATGSSDNYVFRLINANYITIKDLTLKNDGSTYGIDVDIQGNSSYNTVTNCTLTGASATSTSSNKSRVFSNPSANSALGVTGVNNTFTGNTIVNASYAFYLYGSDGSSSTFPRPSGWEISNNTITTPYYGTVYAYFQDGIKILNNNASVGSVGNYFGIYMYECDKSAQVIGNVQNITATTGTSYGIYKQYCDGLSISQKSVTSGNSVINPNAGSSNIYQFYINYCTYDSMVNNTFNITGTGYLYNYYQYNNDVVFNNNTVLATLTYGQAYPMYSYGNGTLGNRNKVNGNTFTCTTTTGYIYMYPMGYSVNNSEANNNNINLTCTQAGGIYNYSSYYGANNNYSGNNIRCVSDAPANRYSSVYGIYAQNNSAALANDVISNNKVFTKCAYYQFGLNHYYGNNTKIFNNSFTVTGSADNNYAFATWYYVGRVDIYNNTVVNDGTSTGNYNYTFFGYNYNYYGGIAYINNNVAYKSTPGGAPVLVQGEDIANGGVYHKADYNNWYQPSPVNFMYNYYWGTNHATFALYKSNTKNDSNSISYPPVFMSTSTGDLRPDPASSNNWSVNGRGKHIAGNNKDMLGNTRAVLTSTGVPDLGAYEFAPNAGVNPPLCVVTPATPAAGITQDYTFGQYKVASITWDAAASVPATAPTCQQYSGVMAPGILSVNNTAMYFYTDILTPSTAAYTANINYMEPWLGTISSENVLRLAKKDGSNPWVVYPIGASGSVAANNYIFSPTGSPLTTWGSYTGLDVANNAGVTDLVTPAGSYCAGTYNVSVKIKNMGSNAINGLQIGWKLDGVTQAAIPYTSTLNFNNGTPGSNEAVVSLGNVTVSTGARSIVVYTYLPNGVTDSYFSDDTLKISLRAALNGVYTIGGASPDFVTPADAVTALNTVGICGPVVFNVRPGTYPVATTLQIDPIANSSAVNRVTFQSENGDYTSVNINNNPTSNNINGVFRLNGCSYITLRNLTIEGRQTGGPVQWGSAIWGKNSSYDSLIGCKFIGARTNTYTDQITVNFYTAGTSQYLVMNNCQVTGGGYYGGICFFGDNAKGCVFNNNIINGAYFSLYLQRMDGMVFTNNTVDLGTWGYGYGFYVQYLVGGATITGNKFNGPNFKDAYYPFYVYNPSGFGPATANPKKVLIHNNVIVAGKKGGNNYYTVYIYGPSDMDFTNNTIVDNSDYRPTSYPVAYFYETGYFRDSIYNNIFYSANTTGRIAFQHNAASGYAHYSDYNCFFTTCTTQMAGTSTHATFDLYRNAWSGTTGYDRNSIFYNPGVDVATGMPVATNPGVWAINGRGVHRSSKDLAGLPRPTTLAAGVPDIGAYEVEPNSIPPACAVSPALPAPGVTQTFKFGSNQVAVIKWNTQLALTAPLTVRQYSGRVPPANFGAMTGGKQMYFYTDVVAGGTGTTYDFNVTSLNYYHTWLGTTNAATSTTAEGLLKLAEKAPSFPWITYNSANSINTPTTAPYYGGYLAAPGATMFGAFTGVDSGLIFTALIKVGGSTILCSGNSVLLSADPTSGGSGTYTYQWKRNGIDILGATSSTYAVTTGGDYTVTIVGVGSQTSTSLPVTVTVVAPPMALVSASGALTFCTGSALQLTASGGGTAYQWALNGTDIPGANSATFNVAAPGNYTVKVSNIGCSTNSTATVVNAGPIAVNLGNDIAGCEIKNQPYILDAGYPGAKYLWSTGDTTQTIEVASGSGTYSVTVDAGPNCKGTDNVQVSLSPLPYVSGIGYQQVGDNKYTFTASGATNVNNYTWIFSDGVIGGGASYTRTFSDNVIVKLVISNGCGSDTIQMAKWATGVSNLNGTALDINVYPNPAKDKVNISVEGATMKDVSIMNSIGEVVYRNEAGNAKTMEVNVSSFASGRYIIRANTSEGIISKPFNVQQR